MSGEEKVLADQPAEKIGNNNNNKYYELGITEVAEHRQIPRVTGEEKMLADQPAEKIIITISIMNLASQMLQNTDRSSVWRVRKRSLRISLQKI